MLPRAYSFVRAIAVALVVLALLTPSAFAQQKPPAGGPAAQPKTESSPPGQSKPKDAEKPAPAAKPADAAPLP